jgi:sugar/nucleoside kinase (ribokinase family)
MAEAGHDVRGRPAEDGFDVLVVGDVVADVIVADVAGDVAFGQAETLVERGVLTVGGSSTITACGAARLGLRVALVGAVGDDGAGRFMLDALRERGVDVSGVVVLAGRATGITVHLVRPGPERDRAMLTALGCAGEVTGADVPGELLRRARHLHVGSYYLLPALAAELPALFAQARRAGLSTSLDPQGDWSGGWRGGIAEVLRETDLCFVNHAEARAIAAALGGAGAGGDGDQALLAAFHALGASAVLKLGAGGGTALEGGAAVRVAAPPATPVDTIGAGDSFDAGFLYGHLAGWPVARSLALAVACGSLSTAAAGGVAAQPSLAAALAPAGDGDA